MSEDEFPGAQVSTFIKGDQFVFRGNTGDELAAVIRSAAEAAEEVLVGLNSLKQAVIAKGVFTGDGEAASPGRGGTTPRKSTGTRKSDAPPPDDVGEVTFFKGEDGESYASIECKHGPMKDLRNSDYKADLYCTLDTKDWKKKCKPVSL